MGILEAESKQQTRTHASAKITVQSHQSIPFDEGAGPAMAELRLDETFAGDLDGDSSVRALQVELGGGLTRMVSIQRFRGRLGGREGTFILQGSETIENGKIQASWFVIPDSGTGQLSGLRGEGGFEGDFGKGSTGTLDYWFE